MSKSELPSVDVLPEISQDYYPDFPVLQSENVFKLVTSPLDLAQIEFVASSPTEAKLRLKGPYKNGDNIWYEIELNSDIPRYNPKFQQLILHEFPNAGVIMGILLTATSRQGKWAPISSKTFNDIYKEVFDADTESGIDTGLEELNKYHLLTKIIVQKREWLVPSPVLATIMMDCEQIEYNPKKKSELPKPNIVYIGSIKNMPDSLRFEVIPGYTLNSPEIVFLLDEVGNEKKSVHFQYLGELPPEDQIYGWDYGEEMPLRIGISYESKDTHYYSIHNMPRAIGENVSLDDNRDSFTERIIRPSEILPVFQIAEYDKDSHMLTIVKL